MERRESKLLTTENKKTMYDTYTPSPETVYIGRESMYLNVISDFKSGKRSFNDLITAYLVLWESASFTFEVIKEAFESIIDEREDEFNFYFTDKKDTYVRYKEAIDSFQQRRTKWTGKIQRV